ncbi:helix-turn-helix transcriptional regulator [Agrobacterium tumefaciens]|nr:helix-turn-helix transcriptional regulator [Agrobacterium tumefaciens]NTE22214.1 helix-turn-helix transcriptional regulator [Agrobacterium tumefaciens]
MVNKYSQIYKTVGENIKKLRKKAKLTQTQLADKTSKVDNAKISNIENANEDYMFSTLLEIASALNVNIKDLLTETNTEN